MWPAGAGFTGHKHNVEPCGVDGKIDLNGAGRSGAKDEVSRKRHKSYCAKQGSGDIEISRRMRYGENIGFVGPSARAPGMRTISRAKANRPYAAHAKRVPSKTPLRCAVKDNQIFSSDEGCLWRWTQSSWQASSILSIGPGKAGLTVANPAMRAWSARRGN